MIKNGQKRYPIKKALLIGIDNNENNDSDNENECLNDILSMERILISEFNYDQDNIKILTNNDIKNKLEFTSIVKTFFRSSQPGDHIFFQYSCIDNDIITKNILTKLVQELHHEITCTLILDTTDPNLKIDLPWQLLNGTIKRISPNIFKSDIIQILGCRPKYISETSNHVYYDSSYPEKSKDCNGILMINVANIINNYYLNNISWSIFNELLSESIIPGHRCNMPQICVNYPLTCINDFNF